MSSAERLPEARRYRPTADGGAAGEQTTPGPNFKRIASSVPVGLAVPQPAPVAAPSEPEGPDAGAVSAKAFIGPNATYYDDRWRWMHWRGRSRTWNWAAAVSFGGWLAYRRMYGPALLHGGWLGLLVALALAGVPLVLLALAQVVVMLGLGFYGNNLYFRHYMRYARKLSEAHREHQSLLAATAEAGGVDARTVWQYVSGVFGLVLLTLMIARALGIGLEI